MNLLERIRSYLKQRISSETFIEGYSNPPNSTSNALWLTSPRRTFFAIRSSLASSFQSSASSPYVLFVRPVASCVCVFTQACFLLFFSRRFSFSSFLEACSLHEILRFFGLLLDSRCSTCTFETLSFSLAARLASWSLSANAYFDH